jgi:integrase/recombinase XerD
MPAHRPARACPTGAPKELFRQATGGWTLHQLRHSALTHLADQNVALPLIMAKSRHTSLRSLQKYARPGVDAVATLTADHDPARRRP